MFRSKTFFIFLAFLSIANFLPFANFLHAQESKHESKIENWPKVAIPYGTLPPNTKVQIHAVKSNTTIVTEVQNPEKVIATASALKAKLQVQDNSNFRLIKEVKLPTSASAQFADEGQLHNPVQLAQQNQLLISTRTVKSNMNCVQKQGYQDCTVQQLTPTLTNSPMEPTAFQKDLIPQYSQTPSFAAPMYSNPSTTFVSPTIAPTAGDNSQNQILLQLAMAAIGMVGQGNKEVKSGINRPTGGSTAQAVDPNCDDETVKTGLGPVRNTKTQNAESGFDSLPGPRLEKLDIKNGPPACAVKNAIAAHKKAGDRVKSDVMVVIDHSRGSLPGKMWFVKTDGSLANVGVPNPIPVSRGNGGFGTGCGSNRTPEGAMVSIRTPHRGRIVDDGVDILGLENNNEKDLSQICGTGGRRKILIHGWNPSYPTSGCFGIPGTLNGRTYRPEYYDTLKQNLFFKGEGKVLIYNLSPRLAKECNSDLTS